MSRKCHTLKASIRLQAKEWIITFNARDRQGCQRIQQGTIRTAPLQRSIIRTSNHSFMPNSTPC